MPDTEARCDCCDLPLYACGTEAARRQAEERKALVERALQLPGVVASKHPGRCPRCDTRYPKGEPISKTDDGWVSELCCPGTAA